MDNIFKCYPSEELINKKLCLSLLTKSKMTESVFLLSNFDNFISVYSILYYESAALYASLHCSGSQRQESFWSSVFFTPYLRSNSLIWVIEDSFTLPFKSPVDDTNSLVALPFMGYLCLLYSAYHWSLASI